MAIFDLNDGPDLVKKQFYIRVAQGLASGITVAQDLLGDGKKKRRLLRAAYSTASMDADAPLFDGVADTGNPLRSLVQLEVANSTNTSFVNQTFVNQTVTTPVPTLTPTLSPFFNNERKKGDKDEGGTNIFSDIDVELVMLFIFSVATLFLAFACNSFRGGDFRRNAQIGAAIDVVATILFFMGELPDKDLMQIAFYATLVSLPFSYGIYKNYGS